MIHPISKIIGIGRKSDAISPHLVAPHVQVRDASQVLVEVPVVECSGIVVGAGRLVAQGALPVVDKT